MSELVREVEELEVTERPTYVVDDDRKAEWTLEQIKNKREELAMWKAHYDKMFENVRKTIESDIVWFEGGLKGYFLKMESEGLTRTTKTGTSKIYDLPSGKLTVKKQEPEYEKDEEAILAWLHEHAPQFIKTKESVDWKGMKDKFGFSGEDMVDIDDETGEMTVIPGVRAVARDEIFKVEVK